MDPTEAVKGLLEASSERELIILVLAVAIGGGLTYLIARKALGMSETVLQRQLDSLDATVKRAFERRESPPAPSEGFWDAPLVAASDDAPAAPEVTAEAFEGRSGDES